MHKTIPAIDPRDILRLPGSFVAVEPHMGLTLKATLVEGYGGTTYRCYRLTSLVPVERPMTVDLDDFYVYTDGSAIINPDEDDPWEREYQFIRYAVLEHLHLALQERTPRDP